MATGTEQWVHATASSRASSRPTERADAQVEGHGVSPRGVETIVVGYDGEEPAQRALDSAIKAAKLAHARLLIVAVLAMPLDPYAPRTFGTLDDSPPPRAPVREPPELKALTTAAVRRANDAGVAAESVWAIGDPARTIVDAARDSHAAKIIVGSHHHSLLERLFGHDVAASVEREAHCEVVVVD